MDKKSKNDNRAAVTHDAAKVEPRREIVDGEERFYDEHGERVSKAWWYYMYTEPIMRILDMRAVLK